MRRRLSLIGTVLALAIVLVGAYVADWKQTGEVLAGADQRYIVLSVLFLIGTLFVFGLRWGQLIVIGNPIPTKDLFSFLMIGYLGNAILPARPGDVLRAVLLRQKYQISLSTGMASIVLERLVDLSAVCGLGLVMSFLVPLPQLILSAIYAVSSGVIGLVFVLVMLHKNRKFMSGILNNESGWTKHQTTHFILNWLERFVSAFNVINSSRRLIACVALTAIGWVFLLAFMMSLILAFKLTAPLAAALLVLIATNLGALLPLSPGAVGVYHFMTVIALSLWGIDSSTAIAFAIASHAIAIGLHIALGSICLWHEGIRFKSLAGLAWTDETRSSQ